MREGWEMKKLGDVCDIVGGGTPSKSKKKYYNGNIPWATVRDMASEILSNTEHKITTSGLKNSSSNKIEKGNVIIATRVGLGKVCLIQQDTAINQDLKALIPKNSELRIDFLFNWYKSVADEVVKNGTGMTVKGVRLDYVKNIQIPIPPLPEQKAIVQILDEAFAKIDQAKANIERNIVNAKEFYENWSINEYTKNTAWPKRKWGDVCDFVRGPFGGSLKKSMFVESGYVVYEQKHAIHNHFNQLRYFINEQKFNEMKRFEVKAGDMIMSCSGVTLGRVAIIPKGIPQGIINQALLKLTPKIEINVNFLKLWLRSPIFQKIIFDHSGGAAQPNVPSAKIMKAIELPCPAIEEQYKLIKRFDDFKNLHQKSIENYNLNLKKLDDLKKSLLQTAFSGELTRSESGFARLEDVQD